MRCQWGTSWDNLQPWIAARRYREFDILDAKLRADYPTIIGVLPALPSKDFFRFLESEVIAKRRRSLEEYMCSIVTSMPIVLRSNWIDEFLGISERIQQITSDLKSKVGDMSPLQREEEVIRAALPPGVIRELTNDSDNFTEDHKDDEEEELCILSVDDAETARTSMRCFPMDEDMLGRFEEDVHRLVLLMRSSSVKVTALCL